MNSLKLKTLASIVGLCVFTGLGFSTWLVISDLRRASEHAQEITDANMAQLVGLLGLPVKIKDRTSIDQLVRRSSVLIQALSLSLEDSDGNLLFAYPDTNDRTICPRDVIDSQVKYLDERVGHLSVCLKPFSNLRTQNATLLTLAILATVLALSFAIYFLINRNVRVIYELMQDLDHLNPSFPQIPQRRHADPGIDHVLRKVHQLFEQVRQDAFAMEQIAQDATIGKLAEQVAHDIRSPLSALRIVAAKSEELDPEKKKLVNDAVTRIDKIAGELLDRSRHKLNQKIKLINLRKTLETIVPLKSWEYADLHHIRLSLDLSLTDNSEFLVNGDPYKLERVLSNLINNSFQALNDGGSIQVRLLQSTDFAEIEVIDDGPGIPQHIVQRIGTDRISHGKDGNGLGLYSAMRVMEEMGGQLLINTSLSGTSIKLQLPLIR